MSIAPSTTSKRRHGHDRSDNRNGPGGKSTQQHRLPLPLLPPPPSAPMLPRIHAPSSSCPLGAAAAGLGGAATGASTASSVRRWETRLGGELFPSARATVTLSESAGPVVAATRCSGAASVVAASPAVPPAATPATATGVDTAAGLAGDATASAS